MALKEVIEWADNEAGNARDLDGFPDDYYTKLTPQRARELQASLYRYLLDSVAGVLTSTGSAGAYVLATVNAAADVSSGIPDKAVFTWQPHIANTPAPTLSVLAQQAAPLVWPDGTALLADSIGPNKMATVRWDAAGSRWLVIAPPESLATTVTEDIVRNLIAQAIQQGAPIWGRLWTWADRQVYSAGAIANLGEGQWMQSTDDPEVLYVRAVYDAVLEIAASAAGDAIQVNGTTYTLAAAPSVVVGTVDVVSVQVNGLAALRVDVEVLQLRARDRAIGESDLGSRSAPAGTIAMFAGETIPTHWLECDGRAVSRTIYRPLWEVFGTTYGVGDGSTTFNLPDLRGRVPLGAGVGSGLTARALGATGGSETHVLTEAEIAAHSHSGSVTITGGAHSHTASSTDAGEHTHTPNLTTDNRGSHTHSYRTAIESNTAPSGGDSTGQRSQANTGSAGGHTHSVTGTISDAGSHSHSITVDESPSHSHDAQLAIDDAGGGQAHNNMQPWIAVKYMVKT